ncbi:hypothetical protein [Streptomyces misionensis]
MTWAFAFGDGTVSRRSYTYDGNGHLAGLDDTLRGPRRFALDTVGRVTAVVADRWSETYAYDRAGGGTTTARWPDAHAGADAQGERVYEGTRVMGAGANRYVYDGAGRLVRRTRTSETRQKPRSSTRSNPAALLTSTSTASRVPE